ncbi:unnamed protein product [Linum tenue]|uniref:Plastid lipid-associated protein/fibrillin conserved domain-containing protein n=1 Tax=Linum tenue TaxID=586396 RepID=A0AAV0J9Y2_9ROSI|nr:unnamed protein product [Linum tenue]
MKGLLVLSVSIQHLGQLHRLTWKVGGISSGLELEAPDCLLPDSCFSKPLLIFTVASLHCCYECRIWEFRRRFPSDLANFSNMDVVIKEGKARATANMKLLYSIESTVTLSSQLTVEGPLRMKEEYIEGILETPKVIEEAVPEQLKGVLGQAISTVQQLPVPIRDLIAGGLRIPLTGTFQRLFLISYLDEEILIMRDAAGVPEVLTRLEAPALAIPEVVSEYES